MIQRLIAAGLAVAVIVGSYLYFNRSFTGYTVRVILADSGGLESGSDVSVNGVTVGRVGSLGLNRSDRAVAVLDLNRGVAPVGAGASATVEIDGFFGETEMLLTRGAYHSHPEPSGYTIPIARSGVSVRLDDVVDALDPDAQGALQAFLDEQGEALVGRGHDLGAVLAELPQSLPSLTALMSQLSANQQALGALVEHSDRVVAQVAAQRGQLARLINSGNGALSALASRRSELGQTVQLAPATLRQAQATLAALQGAAIPLAPAADGLRATAPSLTAALHEIPTFANAAVPTLDEVASVSPELQRLADQSTPVVRALVPLTSELTDYTRQALVPITGMLADKGGAANLFGLMEGWARSTQGYDASSHIFRFGATLSAASFDQLLAMASVPGLPALHRPKGVAPTSSSGTVAPSSAGGSGGSGTSGRPSLPATLKNLGATVSGVVKRTLGTVQSTATAAVGATTTVVAGSGAGFKSLLGYLLGR